MKQLRAYLVIPGMSPTERRAYFNYCAKIKALTTLEAANSIGVSYNHLSLVLEQRRMGSQKLMKSVAAFMEKDFYEVWGTGKLLISPERKTPR